MYLKLVETKMITESESFLLSKYLLEKSSLEMDAIRRDRLILKYLYI